jgi:hypothetical protein
MNSFITFIAMPHCYEKFNNFNNTFQHSYISTNTKKKKKNYLESWFISMFNGKLQEANKLYSTNINILNSLYTIYNLGYSNLDGFVCNKLSTHKSKQYICIKIPFKLYLQYFVNIEQYYTYYQDIINSNVNYITIQLSTEDQHSMTQTLTLLSHLKVPLTL